MRKIAIVGMSCLFPGADTPGRFMANLLSGIDSTTAPTEKQMGVDPSVFYNPKKGVDDKYYSVRGGYINDFTFDPAGLQLPDIAVDQLDDLYKWSLHVSREALRDSGYLDQSEKLKQCGVILGNLSFPTKTSNARHLPIYHEVIEDATKRLLGIDNLSIADDFPTDPVKYQQSRISGYPAALIAKAFSLAGTYFSLDAACSSSLYAVKLASDYLLSGKADMMLAGAVSAGDPFFVAQGFSTFTAYSESNDSRPLDQNSSGLISGEGAGMFVLKRYEDALADNDHIYATIAGVGLSNDGRGRFILAPKAEGQVLAYERAYADNPIHPSDVSYIECHATGTAVGDAEEIDSLDTFFGRHNATPMIGAVKANFGHLLTAAGMPSMMKVILSMEQGEIPGTINVQEPFVSTNKVITEHSVVREKRSWPETGMTRIGAVNAFGFGGTNAHVILERESADLQKANRVSLSGKKKKHSKKMSPMSIVGLGATFGSKVGIEQVDSATFNGQQVFRSLPENRWKGIDKNQRILNHFKLDSAKTVTGGFIEDIDVDILRYKIPPNEVEAMIPQQLLMLGVADSALKDAQVKEGGNIGVIIAMEADTSIHQFRGRIDLDWRVRNALAEQDITLSEDQSNELETLLKSAVRDPVKVNEFTSFIGNVMASRVASLWDFTGPAFTISSEENSVSKALEVAQHLLDSGEVDGILVGAVDLSGNVEEVLNRNLTLRPINTQNQTFSLEKSAGDWMIGEGAGAVVLKLPEVAKKDKDRCYAQIDAIAIGDISSGKSIADICQQALDTANTNAGDIGLLEIAGADFAYTDTLESFQEVYGVAGQKECALSSASANFGHCFAASGMISLIKTAMSLYRQYIPAVPGWSGPKHQSFWEASSFYVETASKPWFTKPKKSIRKASIGSFGLDNAFAHIILSEDSYPKKRENGFLDEMPLKLFAVRANSQAEIIVSLGELKNKALETDTLSALAMDTYQNLSRSEDNRLSVVILADSKDRLILEIDAAIDGVKTACDSQKDWLSPFGSYFTPNPLGKSSKVSFVYPGAFNSYVGMGKDLFQLFPELGDLTASYSTRPDLLFRDQLVFPRKINALTESDLAEAQKKLEDDSIATFETGINAAILNTALVKGIFGVHPDAAFGYSMGEVSMAFSLGVWDSTDKMSRTLHQDPIFRENLAGPMLTARRAWGFPKPDNGTTESIWSCYTVNGSAEEVKNAIQAEEWVYLIIINSPNEVLIAGETQACRRAVESMPFNCVLTPMTDTIHSAIVTEQYDSIVNLHTSPTVEIADTTFYTAATYEQTKTDELTLANNIATIYCQTIDFPKLVQRVHQDGVNIFIEMGPKSNCGKFIDEILNGSPHLAVSIDRKGASQYTSIMRALSRLYSHQVPMDLSILFNQPLLPQKESKSVYKKIPLGGKSIAQSILTDSARARFQNLATKSTQPISSSPVKPEQMVPQQQPREPVPTPIHTDMTDYSTLSSDWYQYAQSQINVHRTQVSASHSAFLETRNISLCQMREMIKLQIAVKSGKPVIVSDTEESDYGTLTSADRPAVTYSKPTNVIWDETDLLEFAGGNIANVFGEEYAIIDSYKYRVRLPLPPYLLAHRVTALDAKRGEFKPSSLTTEYDVPVNAWYSVDGQIPWAIASESGQCDLLLISYLGIDFSSKGERYYRLTDYTMTFMDELPKEGDTLRYEIKIESFMKSGDALIFNFGYECFVRDRLIYKMTGGRAGFFTDAELEKGKGIMFSKVEEEERRNVRKQSFTPLLTCERQTFQRDELLNITRGNIAACFGQNYDQQGLNPSLRFAAESIMMMDRIVSIDKNGGPWGLGEIVAEKDLAPDHWYFPCHFKDDNVLAGTLITEGCVQLLEFYMLYLGLQVNARDARFQPILNHPYVIRARGQIVPKDTLFSYKMEIIEIGLSPKPFARANFYIIMDGKIIVDFRDLGVELVEKQPSDPAVGMVDVIPALPVKQAMFESHHVDEFAVGSLSKCFGPDYDIYEGRVAPRTPNGDLQLITRVLDVQGTRLEFSGEKANLVSEYDVPADVWFFNQNSAPVVPYSMIMEIALQPCGFLSTYMGVTMLYPDVELRFRNLSSDATLIENVDLRGKTATVKAVLLSVAKAAETIVLDFDYEVLCEGKEFYKGRTQFGYFTPNALSQQRGLDWGEKVPPWYEEQNLQIETARSFDLTSKAVQEKFYVPQTDKPFYRMPGAQLEFLDQAWIFDGKGKFDQGYVFATKKVDPTNWFYPCHFFQDPVMPGSLGVESMMQMIKLFALQNDLGKRFKSPYFTNAPGVTKWNYRGQINPENDRMDVEVHIKNITIEPNRVVITADANLWKDKLRIYQVTDAAISIEEAG